MATVPKGKGEMTAVSHGQAGWLPHTEEERAAVLDELDLVLTSPPFRNSKRYTAFLGYVVRETLKGNVDHLKERTLGIEVFHRAPDYDTSTDPIVRVTAGEIRKRLAQCYQGEAFHPFRIDLPSGSYVPVLRRVEQVQVGPTVRTDRRLDPMNASETLPVAEANIVLLSPLTEDQSAPREHAFEHATEGMTDVPEMFTSTLAAFFHHARTGSGKRTLLLGSSVLLAVAVGFCFLVSAWRRPTDAVTRIWAPMFALQSPVLLVVGQPRTGVLSATETGDVFSQQHDAQSEMFFSDAVAVAHICTLIGSHPYEIAPARSLPISDMRKRPIVLIGAFNNPWTVRLLSPLRFSLDHVSDGDSTVSAQVLEIRDRKGQKGSPWSVDFRQPINKMAHDYGIVARFQDETTEGPVVVAAGIGTTGTESAGEFVTSPSYMRQLEALAPKHWNGMNVEAVIQTEVIEGRAGRPQIVAAEFW